MNSINPDDTKISIYMFYSFNQRSVKIRHLMPSLSWPPLLKKVIIQDLTVT